MPRISIYIDKESTADVITVSEVDGVGQIGPQTEYDLTPEVEAKINEILKEVGYHE